MILPLCPDCNQPAQHPLILAMKCANCDGKHEVSGDRVVFRHGDCSERAYFLLPLTDEQIDGHECEACGGTGETPGGLPSVSGRYVERCLVCDGAKRIGAAKNRWVCLGRDCTDSGHRGNCPGACPGRSDIVADDATWREWKQCMKTRTKTITRHVCIDQDGGRTRFPIWNLEADGYEWIDILPEGIALKRGKLTFAVTFEPEEKP
jgi:hypothetical protein